jgi:hypothetical protein
MRIIITIIRLFEEMPQLTCCLNSLFLFFILLLALSMFRHTKVTLIFHFVSALHAVVLDIISYIHETRPAKGPQQLTSASVCAASLVVVMG